MTLTRTINGKRVRIPDDINPWAHPEACPNIGTPKATTSARTASATSHQEAPVREDSAIANPAPPGRIPPVEPPPTGWFYGRCLETSARALNGLRQATAVFRWGVDTLAARYPEMIGGNASHAWNGSIAGASRARWFWERRRSCPKRGWYLLGGVALAFAWAASVRPTPNVPTPFLRERAPSLRLAVARRDVEAEYELAGILLHGRGGIDQNTTEAIRLYRLALGYAYERAFGPMGYDLRSSRAFRGFESDQPESVRQNKIAAERGNSAGQVNLGHMYRFGLGGLPKDEREAVRLYGLAAGQGDPVGASDLGQMYALGLGGLPRDEHEAARLFKIAADKGLPSAQVNLGYLFERGRAGLRKNDREAMRLYKLAAEKGNAVAQANLAQFYGHGRGGLPHDEVEAARLYRLAAAQHYPVAMAQLAEMYALGRGGLAEAKTHGATGEYTAGQLYEAAWATIRGNQPDSEKW